MLAEDQLTAFEQSGYFVLEGVFRGDQLAELQQESEALAASLPASEEEFRIWHERVLFRRKVFRDVLDSRELIEALAGVLGDDVQLLSMDLLLIGPGHDRRRWHRDVSFVCEKPLSVNAGIYLYDMTPQMGPLRIVPGSHRREDGPPEGVDPLDGQIEVPVSAGDLVVADDDGVAFVPRSIASEAAARALEKATTEDRARDLLLEGAKLADVWERFGVL